MDLFSKCDGFTRAREYQAMGIYPYFLPLAGSEGTEVEIGGRRLIMIGSNNYLGLTHHHRVLEAAQTALLKFGTSYNTVSTNRCGTSSPLRAQSARRL